MVPGTGFNAAVALPWLRALSVHWATTVVDLPGQPGLSDPRRPRRARLAWYGRTLDEILAAMDADGVVLVGNSLGAAVALAADSPRIAARALVSPAGFIRLRLDPKLAGMALMATNCRTTLAPPPLSAELLARRAERPCVVGVGEHDRFLPPDRLAPAVRRTMNLDVRVFSGVGHLTTPDHLDEVVSLVAKVVDTTAN
jgi:pimeloyl-ACP methyl ester carboxylesterase